MFTINDRWLRILLPAIPILLLLYPHIMFGPRISPGFFVALLTPIVVCEASRFLVYRSRGWFSGRYRKMQRALVLLLVGVLCVTAILYFGAALRRLLGSTRLQTGSAFAAQIQVNGINLRFSSLTLSLAKALIFFPMLWTVFDAAYSAAKARFTERQRDRLEKEKLQAELQQLKGIVNPHFLFNNLNSLSALIAENPLQAEAFLDRLTNVFRYLLRNNNAELSTVAEELQFIRSYFHLLQTRHGHGIAMEIKVDEAAQQHLLPPLTLQLLVENAVKHNRVQRDSPLCIEITASSAGPLVVRNNRCRREQSVESTGIGLHSINTRLKLLGQPELQIEQNEELFAVTVPLLQPLVSVQVARPQAVSLSAG